jgi:hypothetical protein
MKNLGSANGTPINDKRIEAGIVHAGDFAQISNSVFFVRYGK